MHVAAGKWAERKGVGILRCALLLCLSCVSDHGQIGFCCLGARMAVVTHADQEQSGVGWLLLLLAVADLEALGNECMHAAKAKVQTVREYVAKLGKRSPRQWQKGCLSGVQCLPV